MESNRWLGSQELLTKVVNSPTPKVAVFAAEWCGFCRRFISLIKSPGENQGPPGISIVDVDSGDGLLWEKFRIDIVPTIIVFKDGKEIFRRNGRSGAGLRFEDLEQALSAASQSTTS